MFGDNGSDSGAPASGADDAEKPSGSPPTSDNNSMGSVTYDSHSSSDNSGSSDTPHGDDHADHKDEAEETHADSGTDDKLLELKQQALQQLSPLVSHLDQTPEEKFRTTMMLIQASDNKDLLQEAFEAAQAITDDKVKAQALLDVINEINYFTQPKQEES